MYILIIHLLCLYNKYLYICIIKLDIKIMTLTAYTTKDITEAITGSYVTINGSTGTAWYENEDLIIEYEYSAFLKLYPGDRSVGQYDEVEVEDFKIEAINTICLYGEGVEDFNEKAVIDALNENIEAEYAG